MKTLLPILKTKLFLLGFVSTCTVILATTVPQIRNFIAPEKAIGEKITTEQKKITPKIKKQNKTVSASRVTSGLSFEMNNSFEATITTDQPDYAPRSTATFTGAGFAPNEDVVLKVKNLSYPCNTVLPDSSYTPWTVTADADGNFVTTWTVCDCNGDSLKLKATGQTSGLVAYAFFADATEYPSAIALTSGSTAAQTRCVGSLGNSLTANLSVCGSGGKANISYRWYYNLTNSNTVAGATLVQTTNTNTNASSSTFTPLTTISDVGTRFYFLQVVQTEALTGSGCGSISSFTTPTVQVTVQSVPTAGVIAAAQTICNGGDPAAFTSTTNGTGDGTIAYRWENAVSPFSTWTTVIGQTGSTYDVPSGLTVTTQYRRITISTLNTVACESTPTSPVQVTVQSVPTAGTITAAQTICNSGDPAAFNSSVNGSGSGAITYRWESAVNPFTTWSTVPGQTAATYDVPSGLTVTTQYRRITISTQNSIACESVPTSTVQVTVQSVPVAGTIGGDQTICNGGDPAIFTNTGVGTGSGTITYRWESAVSPFTTWVTVAGQTLATYNVPSGLTVTTQYRRITISTQNGVPCESVPTGTVQVTVQSVVTAGTIAASQTICNGGDPAALTSTTDGDGDGTITYRWESAVSPFTTWTTVAGETGETYDVPSGLTVTTQYRRITISTLNTIACESVPTGTIQVTVQAALTAGTIAASQTICNGGDPAGFTSTINGTGSGTITYRWESSVSPFTTWTTVGGQTASTYNVPSGLTVTTQYRRITISTQNSIACESVPTTPVQITVQSVPVAGTIGSDQTICNGGDPAAFTSNTDGTGDGTITYRWESSVSPFTTWTTVAGQTAAIYNVPSGLTVTTQYRRITISTVTGVPCESVPTATVQVTVQAVVTAGTIAASQTICNGGDPAAFTNTGSGTGSGAITYRWESSVSPFSTWTTIVGQTSSTYDVPSGLTVTTQYRRITISTQNTIVCESVPTATVQVTVQSVPTTGTITGDQTICNGGDPAIFTNTGVGTGSGTITYRWESAVSPFTTWVTVAGQTLATYNVPSGLTVTTQYRRITISTQNGVPCESVPTGTVQVTVQSVVTAGTIAASQTICNGGDPAALTSTTDGDGDGVITYRWESAVSPFSTWTPVAGQTAATYDIPSGLSVTTQYRRITISTLNTVACESAPTATVQVTVQSIVTSGTIAASQTICNGGDPVGFTNTGSGTGSGAITYRWESAVSPFTTWTTVPGQTGSTYDVPSGLTVTTQYRRITISTQNTIACESAPTSAVQVTVQSVPTAGAIGSDQDICSGGDPAAFTSTTNGTGDGAITYRWESSVSPFTTWTTIGGQTASTYDVPSGLTVTTQYRRITISTLNSIVCESVPTDVVQVTVNPLPTPVITGSSTACAGEAGSVYSVTNVTGDTYSWTVVGGTISLGAGTNSITVTWGAAGPGTVNVTETITATNCSAAATQKSVTINALPTLGITVNSPTICSGGSTTIMFSGTKNSTVTYNKNGTLQPSITLNNGGNFNPSTGALTTTTTYDLVSITDPVTGCVRTTGFSPASVTVTVNQPPSITAAAWPTVNNDNNVCGKSITLDGSNITLNSGSPAPTYTYSLTNFGTALTFPRVFPVGTTTVFVRASNVCGNDIESFTVTVVDNQLPVITCPGTQILNLNASCSATLPNYTSLATATDNCPGVTISQSPVAGTPVSTVGSFTVTLKATDASNNTSTCSFTVNKVDITPPAITCPATQTLNLTANCDALVPDYTTLATATDGCAGTVTITQLSPGVGSTVSAAGSFTVTLRATDANTNTSTCSFTVNKVDITPPTITCPATQTVTLDASCEGTLGNYISLATANDACSPVTVTQSPVAGTAANGTGTVTVTLTAKDASNNTSTCSFTVNKVDVTPPTITCPATQIVTLDADCEGTLGNYISLATANDACSPVTVTQSPVAGTAANGTGTVTVTLTAKDASNNTSTCSFTVNKVDVTPPTITCPATQIVTLDADCEGTLGNYISLATANDACSPVTVTQSPVAGTAANGTGTVTVTLTAKDASNNTSTCSFTVNKVDVTPPTITCPATQTVTLDGSCEGTLGNYISLATANDACSPVTVTQSPIAGTAANGTGTVTVTLTAKDASNNTSTCSFTVNKVDVTPPTITCPATQTVTLDGSCEGTLGNYISLATANDACSPVTVTQSPAAGTTANGTGTVTVTLTAKDASNNTSTCSFTVNKVDVTPPTITCPATQTVTLDGSCEGTLGNYISLATANDACSPVTVTQSPIAGTAANGTGTVTVTLTAKDASNNTSTCSFTVNKVDVTPPTITCPATQTVTLDGSCEGTLGNYISLATANDACSPVTVTQSPIAGTAANGTGTVTVTLTAKDASNNTSTCSFTVNKVDVTPPTITCPATQTVTLDGSCEGTLGNYISLATANDACSPVTVTQSPLAGTAANGTGTVTVTLTAKDASNNTSTCSFTVNKVDVTPPAITCPATQTVTLDASCNGTLGNYIGLATANDACSPVTVTQSPIAGTAANGTGIVTVTLTAKDASNNTSTCSFTVNKVDVTPPAITCPATQTVTLDGSCEGTLGNYISLATANDACSPVTVTQSPAAGSAANGTGTVTVTLTAKDASNNTSTCSFTVNKVDVTPPTITCPATQTVTLDASCEGTLGNYISLATANDACSPVTVTQSPVAGTAANGTGTVTVTLTAKDASNNTSTCSFTVNKADVTPPTITCPATQTVTLDASCQGTLGNYISLATANDACSPVTVTQSPVAGTAANGTGTVTVTLTAKDASNNTSTCSFTVNKVDVTPPTITCPATQTVTLDASCNGTLGDYTSLATANDACSPVTVTQSPVAGTAANGTGTVTVTLTAKDASNNTSTCSFTVNKVDVTPPTITCPATQTVTLDASCQGTLGNYISLATANDACSPVTVTQSPLAGTAANGTGTVTVTLTAKDASNNTSTCSFTVNKVDVTPPTITCPATQTVTLDASCQGTLGNYISLATANDACSPVTVTQSPVAGTAANGTGTITVTLTAKDASNNTSTCSFTVNKVDVTPPTITCPATQTVTLDASCEGTLGNYISLATANDACSPVTVTQSPVAGTAANGTGTVTVTLTAKDASNNTSTCSFTVNKVDVTPPTITCPPTQTVTLDASCEGTLGNYISLATANDACSPVTVIQSPVAGTAANGTGTVTVTLTAKDASNNTSTCSFTVNKVDVTPPTITCPATQTVTLNSYCNGTLGNYISLATANDACSPVTVTQSPVAGTAANGTGTVTVTLTAKDASNNTSTCSFTVNKVDVTPPTITCPPTQTVTLDASCEGTLGNYIGLATVNDACSPTTVTQSPAAGSAANGTGTVTVTLTAKDASNNTSTCSFAVNKVDVTPPTITCPATQTVILDASCNGTLGNYIGLATANDACSPTTVTQSPAGGTAANGTGTVTVTLTAKDASNNTSTCSFTVNKVDVTPPTITCPATQTVTLNSYCNGTLGNYIGLATVNDACSPATVTQSPAAGSAANGTGTVTVTLTAKDASNNTSTCSFTVNKVDVTPPTITCPPTQTVTLDASCNGTLGNYIGLAIANDACSPTTVTQSPAAGSAANGTGTVTVTLTAKDASNNTSTCSFTVNKVDVTPPTITCPSTQTVTLNSYCNGTLGNYISLATANDACSPVTVTQSPAAGSAANGTGTVTVTLTAKDASNNTSTCSFTVNKVDVTPPTITCPVTQTLTLDGSCNGTLGNYIGLATVNDACSPTTVTQSPAAGSAANGTGTVTVTLTAKDASNNTSTCSFTVNKVDVTPPTITCPATQTLNLGPTCTAALPDYTTLATANDACSPVTVTQSPVAGTTVSGTGNVTVTLTAKDASNNTSTCSFTVTKVDVTPPTITCPASSSYTRSTDTGQCDYTIVAGDLFNASASDACGTTTLTWYLTNPNAATQTGATTVVGKDLSFGLNTIKWIATDASGNTSTCSFTVNVNKVTTTTTFTVAPTTQQYSDLVTFTATVTPYNCAGAGDIGGTVTFKIGTQTMGTAPVVNGTATLANVPLLEPTPFGTSPTGQMAPGTRNATATFSGTDADYIVNNPAAVQMTINKENVTAQYTGGEFASTGTATATSAGIRFSASLIDAADGNRGDIRNARVRFKVQPYDCNIAMTPLGIFYTKWLPVSLVNLSDNTIGTAFLDTTLDIGACNAKIYDITVEVDNYYTGYSDVVTISVAKSLNDFITGGGHLDFGAGAANKSSGPLKSSDNSKVNWGFNVKYNKNQSNLQGNVNIIIRSGGQIYQVKGIVGGSNGTLSVDISDPNNRKAKLTAKANLTNLTTGLAVPNGSNATMELKMTDKGEPGANVDTYAITIWGADNTLLYSSNWSGTISNEVPINGGNIQVRSGTVATIVNNTKETSLQIEATAPIAFNVKVFPNPSQDQFSLYLEGGNNDKVHIVVYDALGREVKKFEKEGGNIPVIFGRDLKGGSYFVEVRQGENHKTIKLIKQN